MEFGESERERLLRAHVLAFEWHAAQTRKQTDVPYVSHLMQVAGAVFEFGGDADQATAGLLHDALEDAPSAAARAEREARIASEFGAGVLDMVIDCTDTAPGDAGDASPYVKAPWTERKQRFLARLDTAAPRSLLVIGCDKRHNLLGLVRDLENHGPATLERFNAGAEQQLWYFEGVLAALAGRVPSALERDLEQRVSAFRALVR